MTRLAAVDRWRFYAGHVHGLQQSAAVGAVRVMPGDAVDPVALDAAMAELIGPAQVPGTAGEGDAARTLAGLLARWVIALQRQARIALSDRYHLGPARPAGQGGAQVFPLALPCVAPEPFSEALRVVLQLAKHLLDGGPDAPTRETCRKLVAEVMPRLEAHALPGFNRVHLASAAYRLGLPVRTIAGEILVFGTGARSRMANSTVTDETLSIAMLVSRNKWITARLLREAGLPVPEHQRVADADEAVAAAERLGYPVVVKPLDQDQGRGVAAHLRSAASVRAAYAAAREVSANIMVERHVEGFGHRLTLHRGELIAVLKRIPGGVTGDGRSTVEELLERRRLDPTVRANVNLGRVTLDEQALELLAEAGLARDSVPAAGRFVLLRRRDNISVGGTIEILQAADVHPDNLAVARRAARVLRLDLAGVDLLIPDVGVSWKASGGAICEVNGMPQFGPGHDGRNYERLLRAWVGSDARIPVALYLCPDDAEAALPARLTALAGRLGLESWVSRRALSAAGQVQAEEQANGFVAARVALFDPATRSLLIAMTPQDVLTAGLPVDRVDAVHAAPAAAWPPAARVLLDQALSLAGIDLANVRFETPVD